MAIGHWLLLIAAAGAMATSLPFNKVLVADIAPITLAALRVAIGAPILLAVLVLARQRLPLARHDLATASIGSACHVALPFAAIAWGQQYIPSGLGGILYATTPLCTAIFAHMLTADEKLAPVKLAGIAVGIAGVALVIGWSAVEAARDHLIGVIVSLIGPVSFALGSVLLRRRNILHPLALTTAMYLQALVLLAAAAFILEEPVRLGIDRKAMWQLAGLATVGTVLPTILNYILIRRAGATNASLVMFLVPPITVILGIALLAEPIATSALAGMGLIVTGSYLVARNAGDFIRGNRKC
jgi:drug/metabolite transporter (DMT)-like permease